MSVYVDEFNLKLDFLLRDNCKNAANPRMEKQDQWVTRLIQIDREGTEVNADYILRKKFEVTCIRTENRLMRKSSLSQWRFKYVTVFKEVYQAVREAHAAVVHGGESKTFAETKKKWLNITQECCSVSQLLSSHTLIIAPPYFPHVWSSCNIAIR